jgi:TolB protein
MTTASLAMAVLLVVCLAVAPAACGGGGGVPAAGKIAFNSERDGNWEIYVMNADRSDVTRLTDNPAVDTWPSWSPVP